MEENSIFGLELHYKFMEEFNSLCASQEVLQLRREMKRLTEELKTTTDQLKQTIETKNNAVAMLEMLANMNREELIKTQVQLRHMQEEFNELNENYLKVQDEKHKLRNLLREAQKTVVNSENRAKAILEQYTKHCDKANNDQLERDVDEKWEGIRHVENAIHETVMEYYQTRIKNLENDVQDYQQLKENFNKLAVENGNLKFDNHHLELKVGQLESNLKKVWKSHTRCSNFIQRLETKLKTSMDTCKQNMLLRHEEAERNKIILKKQRDEIQRLNYQLSQRKKNASKEEKNY